jgi:hypothetical protein
MAPRLRPPQPICTIDRYDELRRRQRLGDIAGILLKLALLAALVTTAIVAVI